MCFKFFAKFKFKRAFLVPWKQATACHVISSFPLLLNDGLHSLTEDGSSPGLQRKKLLFASSKKEKVLWATSQQPGHSRSSQAMAEADVPEEGQSRDHCGHPLGNWCNVQMCLKACISFQNSLFRSLFVGFSPSLHRSSKSLTRSVLDQHLTFPRSLFGVPALG